MTAHQRDLPWRRTSDPYAIWVSEDHAAADARGRGDPVLSSASSSASRRRGSCAGAGTEVLALWSGLGYYSRARNLQKAARQISRPAAFPRDYESIRALAGVGDYTAAAVASIAFGLPHAVVDGNVRRVVMRLAGDAAADVGAIATDCWTRRDPGRWNQAVMELGATVCLPREPLCAACPSGCGIVKPNGAKSSANCRRQEETGRSCERSGVLLVIRRKGRILLIPSPRVSGFWELPEFPKCSPAFAWGQG